MLRAVRIRRDTRSQSTRSHGNHAVQPAGDDLLRPGARGVCQRCHTDDAGARSARALLERLEDARRQATTARARLAIVQELGLLVPDAELAQSELSTALMRLRISVHDIDPEAMQEQMDAVGKATGIIVSAADAAIADVEFRRRGYLVFVALIALLAALLTIKLRRLER